MPHHLTQPCFAVVAHVPLAERQGERRRKREREREREDTDFLQKRRNCIEGKINGAFASEVMKGLMDSLSEKGEVTTSKVRE